MGNVLVVFRVMPESPDAFERVKEGVRRALEGVADIVDEKEEPIAFGLKALLLGVKVPDTAGAADRVEEALSKVEGVESVSVEKMTLI